MPERARALRDVDRPTLRIVAISGSLRQVSFNRALVDAARQLAPNGMIVQYFDIGGLPFYDADVEARGDPPGVVAFKGLIGATDGLLIATPEYNAGIPGVLTNAIDWASRLPGASPLSGKPVALMGASRNAVGTARAQLHLRQILHHVDARPLPPPELLVAQAHDRFDSNLQLVDDATRQVLTTLLERFAVWICRERAAGGAAA
jgi:chromate reductase